MKKPRSHARATPATPAETAARVDLIAGLMRHGAWVRGESDKVLAKDWGLAVSTVQNLTAEAWRRVCAEADSPKEARPNIVGTLLVAMERALAAGKYNDVAKIADVWTRIIGAREPEKHEVAMTEEQARAKYLELTGTEWCGPS